GLLALTAAEPSAAYKAGYVAGSFFPVVCFLLGIVKCVVIARRPTASAWGPLSLACALAGWLVATLAGMLPNLLPAGTAATAARFLCALAFIGLTLVALVLAIIGLVHCHRHP